MNTVLQFILDLFRNENAAQAFVANPNAALADAGLADVTPQQLQSVAATAVPGLELAPADPIAGLQQAVSNQFGFAPVESVLPEVGAGIVTDQAAQIGLDGGSAIAAALGDGIGAGLGAGLEGGAELAGQTAVGLGTGLGLGGGAELGGGFDAGLGAQTGAGQ